MPGPASHLHIAEKIADSFSFYTEREIKTYSSGVNEKYYKMGSTGPDLWFFAPDYDVIRYSEILLEYVNSVVQPIKGLYEDTIKPVVDQVQDVQESVDAVLDDLTCQNISNIKTRTDQISETIAALRDSFFVKIFTDSVNTFDLMQHPVHNEDEPDDPKRWFWFDILHSQRTGEFLRAMWSRAETDRQRAYVLGYASHCAADITVHPYINQAVGGAGRAHNQRHHFVENILDVWFYDEGSAPPVEIIDSQLHLELPYGEELDDDGTLLAVLNGVAQPRDDLSEIFSMVSAAMADTFPEDERPTRLPDGVTSAEDINLAYWYLLASFKVSTDSYIPPPLSPTEGVLEAIDEAMKEFLKTASNAPTPPGSAPDICYALWSSDCDFSLAALEDWLKHLWDKLVFLAELIAWAAEMLVELFKLLVCTVTAPLKATVSALLWIIQSALRDMLEEIRHALALASIVHPTSDWVRNSPIATEITSLHNKFVVDSKRRNYPRRAQESNEGFLSYPATSVEGKPTAAGPYPAGSNPLDVLNGLAVANVGGEALYTQYENAANPDEHREIQFSNAGKTTYSTIDLGRKLFFDLVGNAGGLIPDWNLDADRGFQYKNWTVENEADWGTLHWDSDGDIVPEEWHQ